MVNAVLARDEMRLVHAGTWHSNAVPAAALATSLPITSFQHGAVVRIGTHLQVSYCIGTLFPEDRRRVLVPMTIFLLGAAVLNTVYLFTPIKLYRLHLRPDPVSSLNTKFVAAQLDFQLFKPPSGGAGFGLV
ncbi:hypothetical protein B0H14DRAFT_3881335 [Mycena olivaceomarginata]|nr:hypothetical protein B0H14DRAFT_3881335 [Mycena olivaceomarginata]